MAETTTTTQRLRTGVPGLDDVLGGGLIAGRTILLKGVPGSGKTTLGLQMLVAGALQFDEPGILLTFEQVPDQLYADAAGFGWDLAALVEQGRLRLQFIKPGDVLENPGRQEHRLLADIADWAEDTGARRILIDSISHLRPLFNGELARAQLMHFLVQLKSLGLSPIMTAELNPAEGLAGLDAYLVDSLIHLAHEGSGVGHSARRQIEVIKTRGQQFIGGAHPFEIGPHGITVYPHIYPARTASAASEPTPQSDIFTPHSTLRAPLSSGVTGLDPLLGGGYAPGSTILVAGLSGTFKTTLAAHFLLGETGQPMPEPGLWLTFQETTEDLDQLLGDCGFATERAAGHLHVMESEPGSEPAEKLLLKAEGLIRQHGIRRVVIDSMNELAQGAANESERQEALHWLLRRLRALGVTTLVTQRLARVTGRNPLSEISNPEQAGTIIYLGLVEIESRLEKVISVLKHRGGPTEGDLRSIQHTPRGLRISERFVGLSGVLQGTPLGRPKARIEEIFQPLYFIRDFLTLAKEPSLASEQRSGILENLSKETAQLIELLGKYFDQPQTPKSSSGVAPKDPQS